MKRIQRLLEAPDCSEYEHWLLQSAASERPAASSIASMRAGLGLASGVAARVTGLSGLKMTLLAISAGAFLGLHGTEPHLRSELRSTIPSERVAFEVAPSPMKTDAPAVQDPPVFNSYVQSEPPQQAPARVNRPKERVLPVDKTRTSSGPDLREEIRLLDSARNAVKAHQPEVALESLNTYSTRFPAGAFKQEASVLRIQAVALRGELTRASSMAKQFVESNPNSPYVGKASRIANGPGSAGAAE